MVITRLGDGCFRLQSGETSILVDPENNRLKGDIVLRTIAAAGEPSTFAGADSSLEGADAATIAFPGEYEIKGIEIVGFQIPGESTEKFVKTAYVVTWEEMKFALLGHLSKPVDASLMEEFAEPDVLILPVGGGHFLEPDVAAKMAKQLEAAAVIPSFAKDPGDFLKAFGKKAEPMEKFVFKKKDLVGGKGRAIILSINA
jgi:L-ascorbate metabolism protein UlaG (beta-lactamase superfamily)